MAGGRPRLPDNVKRLKGTERKCRVNKNAPQLDVKFPKPPRGSTKEERKIWRWLRDVIEPMRVTSSADVAALKLLARSIARWERAIQEVTDYGSEYYESEAAGGAVTIKLHPAVRVAMECERYVLRALVEFGLTPASRSKVNAAPDEDGPGQKIRKFVNRRKHASG